MGIFNLEGKPDMSNRVRWSVGSGLLIFLGITANKWAPLLLSFVTSNVQIISGLADLSTLFLFVCGVLALIFGFRSASNGNSLLQKSSQSQELANPQQPSQTPLDHTHLSSVQKNSLSPIQMPAGSTSGASRNSLTEEYIRLIIDLLEESGRVVATEQRVTLLQEIGLNPNRFKTYELNPHDFSVMLANSLNKQYPPEYIRILLRAISQDIPRRITDIESIEKYLTKLT